MDFAVLVDHRIKIKESKKRDKYQTLLKNWPPPSHPHPPQNKKLWNMMVMVLCLEQSSKAW